MSETYTVLIQCTKSKRDQPCKARKMYDPSTYFRNMRDYAKLRGDKWFILSAKHGLLHPDTEIEPYDAFGLTEELAIKIANQVKGDTIELVAGKEYTDPLTPELEKRGFEVLEPLRGLRIGKRQQVLKQKTRKLQNESLC